MRHARRNLRRWRRTQRHRRRRRFDRQEFGVLRSFHRFFGWFLGRHRLDRQFRQPVPASGSGLEFSVGDQHFALRNSQGLLRPEHAVSHTVGNIHEPAALRAHRMSFLQVEFRIMFRDDRIIRHRVFQFIRASCTARNDRIRKKRILNRLDFVLRDRQILPRIRLRRRSCAIPLAALRLRIVLRGSYWHKCEENSRQRS